MVGNCDKKCNINIYIYEYPGKFHSGEPENIKNKQYSYILVYASTIDI